MNRAVCPYCDHKLASDLAQQCLECGMDWHDPDNIVRRGKQIDFVDRATKLISGYERGYYTANETASKVIDFISQTNVKLIVPILPEAIMQRILEIVASAPFTEENWEKHRTYSVSSYCGQFNDPTPIETDAERECREANAKARYRYQIEALRTYSSTYDQE